MSSTRITLDMPNDGEVGKEHRGDMWVRGECINKAKRVHGRDLGEEREGKNDTIVIHHLLFVCNKT